MALPITFATLPGGNQSLARFDTQFSAIGALVFVPCAASGQNNVLLTPSVNTPTITTYVDNAPVFVWTQSQTSTGAVTINVAGIGSRNGYKNNGQNALASGDLVANASYQGYFLTSLNGGAGGFVVDSIGAPLGTLSARTVYSSSQTIVIPNTTSSAIVRMWGATGGSGGVSGGTTGGTGAGGYLEKSLTGLIAGQTLIYTQGAAGAAGTNAPGNGGNGTITTLASGTQSISTLTCNASNGSLASSGPVGIGTAGGSATGGDINVTGNSGSGAIRPDAGLTPYVGIPGATFYSLGALGVISTPALAGNPGSPGGLIIEWFA